MRTAPFDSDLYSLPNKLLPRSLHVIEREGHLHGVYLQARPSEIQISSENLPTILQYLLVGHETVDPYCSMLETYWSQLLQEKQIGREITTRVLPVYVPNYTAYLPTQSLQETWQEKVALGDQLILYKVGRGNWFDRGLPTGITLLGNDFYACTPPVFSPEDSSQAAFITRRVDFETVTGEGKLLSAYWNNRNLPNR